ncbi:Alpha/Beta hydrolase protein [Crepidotus variabilis]|uniref:Alpha/Beta hydrolase protein n=1 Tax=Crepidotus variabilis TaxID=179855 RepID=A0A9P6JSP7_9AGAR|nr:Alpha/Beta hydrolase protein [Crepidotus variabilis]
MAPSNGTNFPSAFNPVTCLRRGLCPVTKIQQRSGSATIIASATSSVLGGHSLYYEQHGKPGSDPVTGAKHKILFIMGLNSTSFSWGPQVRYFGGGREGGDCTALVFDNRGVGNSDYPKGPYTSSGMAEDAICLLDYLGWTGDREIHVVGISLGGMIAQELAFRIPHRICSLVLAVTTPGSRAGGFSLSHTTPWKGVSSLLKLTFTTDPRKKALIALGMLFPEKWLNEVAETDPHAEWPRNGNTKDNEQHKTNRDVQMEGFLYRADITKPQLFGGNLSQTLAALTHNFQPERLAYIAANIPKIAIVTGDEDHLVNPTGSERLHRFMKRASDPSGGESSVEYLTWEGTGHAIHSQREKLFNGLVERCAVEGRSMIDNGWKGKDVS